MITKHLAIFRKDILEQILAGQKKVESRFSQHKIAPFGKVSMGDIVYIKPPGEEIKGQFRVKKVIYFDGLTKEDVELIKSEWDLDLWVNGSTPNYATLIFIDRVEQFITSPLQIKKKDLRGWMVLD